MVTTEERRLDAREAEELVRLASADNFRDVAGPGRGYPTTDGGRVRTRVFFRSNELQLTDEDAASLAALDITAVHDLRSAEEIAHHPDVAVPGASWHHVDVLGIPLEQMSALPDRAAAVAMMERVYRGFVEDAGTRAALGTLLARLAEPGVHLFHCSAGKDRTGWTAALLLHLAGVDRTTIVEDYLLTNEYAAASRAATLELVATHLGPEKVEVYEPVLGADADFLQTAYAAVETKYGDLDRYLALGLGLSATTRATLVERLRA